MLPPDKKYFIPILLFSFAVTLCAEMPISSKNINIFDDTLKDYQKTKKQQKNKKKIIYIEPFCRNLARKVTYWEMTAQDLQILKNKGLGYSELVKVILMSKETTRTPAEIVKRRQRGESFKKICKRYEIDYVKIRKKTKEIMSEVKIYGTE